MLPDVSNKSALNQATVDELMQREKNGQPLFLRLFSIYLEETPRLIEELRAAVADRDVELAYETIHQMKGSAAAMGADRLYALAEAALHLSQSEELFGVEDLAERLESEANRYIRHVEALLNRRQQGS